MTIRVVERKTKGGGRCRKIVFYSGGHVIFLNYKTVVVVD